MFTLEDIADSVIRCSLCPLHATRNHAVPGEGSAHSGIVLLGEGPGYHEDQQGRPFVGASGNLLNELIMSNNLKRSDLFITNIVKCRPPSNRDPSSNEIATCSSHLNHQLSVIKPSVIMTLGRHALSNFFPNELISKVRGTVRQSAHGYTILPTYHPAAILRNPSLRPTIEQDFKTLVEIANQVHQDDDTPKSKQLPMFS